MTTPEHIDSYLKHLAQDRQLASSTLTGYRQELTLLVDRGVDLEAGALVAYLATGKDGSALEPTTRNRKLIIIRSFCQFLVDQGELRENPTVGIRRSRIPETLTLGLSIADLQRVIVAIRSQPLSWRRVRDETIVSVLFYTGLRVSELVSTNTDQVDLKSQVLRGVTRKGGKIIDVPLNDAATEALTVWLAVRPECGDAAVIIGRGGKRLSVRMMEKRLKQLGKKAELSIPLHPHALRHAHATALLAAGVQIELIRQSLSHRSIMTTARYLHGDEALLRKALDRLPIIKGEEAGEEDE